MVTADEAPDCPVHTHINAMTKRHSGTILPSDLPQDNIASPMLLVSKFCSAVATLTIDELLDGAFLDQGMPASTKAEREAAVAQRNVRGDTSTPCFEMYEICTAFKCSLTPCCRHNTA